MDVNEHSLDDKIVKAAFDEFLEHGFQSASLNKISSKAGITIGALYTRYKNKDALFCSLIQEVFSIQEKSKSIVQMYYKVRETKNVDDLIDAIKREDRIYLDILFQYYYECILFFCKSTGNSIDAMLNKMMEQKSKETVLFLRELLNISEDEIDLDRVGMVIIEQFQIYKMILKNGYDKKKAVSCMEA